jgi:4'-phosphopantetheinyl transferase EntD
MDPDRMKSDTKGILEPLFPNGVASIFSESVPANLQLHPEELQFTKKMAERRLQEFQHGRSCARLALSMLDQPPGPVGRGKHREPLWPAGCIGSISHAGDHAAAAVAAADLFLGIGLDMEFADPIEDGLIASICRPDEIDRVDDGEDMGYRAKLLFSIKESIYKCLWPLTREFVDFTEIEVRLVDDSNQYEAIPHTAKCDAAPVNRLSGRYRQYGNLILASAYISKY